MSFAFGMNSFVNGSHNALLIPYLFCSECQDQVYDIYFVADKSISITDKELDMERTVIRHIIAGLDLGTWHGAMSRIAQRHTDVHASILWERVDDRRGGGRKFNNNNNDLYIKNITDYKINRGPRLAGSHSVTQLHFEKSLGLAHFRPSCSLRGCHMK